MIIISAIVRVIEQSIGTPSKPAQLAYFQRTTLKWFFFKKYGILILA